jgi:Peptidase family M48
MTLPFLSSRPTAGIVLTITWGCRVGICFAGLALTATNPTAQQLSIASAPDLLRTDPAELVRLLEAARPAPVPTIERASILSGLPENGEVHDLDSRSQRKLAALLPVLEAAQRESVYEIKVIDVPQAAVGIHERLVLLISRVALGLLSADELQAVVAHEIGHEYVWADRERAVAVGDHEGLQDLELVCDIIAVTILRGIGRDASPLIAGIEKISRFNTAHIGTARNQHSYPALDRRRSVIRAVSRSAEKRP